MALKLSILIATIPERSISFWKLFHSLEIQHTGETMEILTDSGMDCNIGAKRNRLLKEARGEYVVFVDDDDTVSEYYVSLIMEAIESGPDCVGICGLMTTNGQDLRKWFISKEYGSWYEKDSDYYRTPNHISPVKREIALAVGFPEVLFGEDYHYSMGLLPYLKTEVVIPELLYHYQYNLKS